MVETLATLTRRIPLDGIYNFRDLGGYRSADGRTVRWRTVYRSDALRWASDSDVRTVARGLGVNTVVDLRTEHAVAEEGTGPIVSRVKQYHHLPLFGEAEVRHWQSEQQAYELTDLYVWILESRGKRIRHVFEQLAQVSSYPVVFHCFAGKDRTGVIAALLLGALGISRKQIVADYALTEGALSRIIARLEAQPRRDGPARPPSFLEARPETMTALLDWIDERHGSVPGYLSSVGVSETVTQQLCSALLVRHH